MLQKWFVCATINTCLHQPRTQGLISAPRPRPGYERLCLHLLKWLHWFRYPQVSLLIPQTNMAAKNLCVRDREILESIFNPSLTFGIESISTETQRTESITNGHDKVETESEKKAREFEVLAVTKAEEGDIASAVEFLNEAVLCCPSSASAYNNRAQVFLLQGVFEVWLYYVWDSCKQSTGKTLLYIRTKVRPVWVQTGLM